MRLIREMPETAEQLVEGSLTLETMSTLSNHFRASKPSREVRRQLVSSAQNLSKRELERKLGKPEMTAVYLKPDLIKKLNELKIVFGMTSLERILERLADQALAQARVPVRVKESKRLKKLQQEKASSGRVDSGRRSPRELAVRSTPLPEFDLGVPHLAPPAEQKPTRRPTPPREQLTKTAIPNATATATDSVTAQASETAPANRSRYVPKPVRKSLIQRDQAQCAYIDPLTKRQCSETRHLEFDHSRLPGAERRTKRTSGYFAPITIASALGAWASAPTGGEACATPGRSLAESVQVRRRRISPRARNSAGSGLRPPCCRTFRQVNGAVSVRRA